MKALLICAVPLLLWGGWHEHKEFEADYHKALSQCKSMGDGWRLPDIRELFSLRGQSDAFSPNQSYWAINTVYDGVVQGDTGSEGEGGSTQGTLQGFTFFLQDGDITLTPLHKRSGVICTDVSAPDFASTYKKQKEGVLDEKNNLIWLKFDATDAKSRYNFEEAQAYCENLSLYHREWRLPTLDELYSIVNYNQSSPSVQSDYFGMMMQRYYWSATLFGAQEAYVVGFKFGSVATSSRKNRSYVRCVSDL